MLLTDLHILAGGKAGSLSALRAKAAHHLALEQAWPDPFGGRLSSSGQHKFRAGIPEETSSPLASSFSSLSQLPGLQKNRLPGDD